jgi:hypothetical protein
MDRPEHNGRLQKAIDFVLSGAVTLRDDGSATVKSGTHLYELAPDCPCQESQTRSQSCKHFLAVQLLNRTYERLGRPGNRTSAQRPQDGGDTPSQPPAWHGPQAPASCTLKWQLNGIELLLTLRDTTDDALFTRIKRVLPRIIEKVDAQRQTPRAEGQRGNGHGAGDTAQGETPYCRVHGVPMQQYTKGNKGWFSHRTAHGAWCPGK